MNADKQIPIIYSGLPNPPGARTKAFWFALHSFLALVIGGATAVLVTGGSENLIENSPTRYTFLSQVFDWYGPYVFLVGFVLGFIVNRYSLKGVACYAWTAGLAWLFIGVWSSIHNYEASFYQGCSVWESVSNSLFVLNGRKCGGGASTLAGVFFTIPSLTSVAYSIGAWMVLRLRSR